MIRSLLYFGVVVLMIVSLWKVFEKAGEPGWAAIIPIYNVIVLLKIIGKPWWWILLLLIPVVNIVLAVIMYHRVSRSFGQGVGFTLGLIILSFIFIPLLAFGEYSYSALND
jgi:hypothetical protein